MAERRRKHFYKPPDYDKVKKAANEKGGGFDSIFASQVEVWNPKEGDHLIRFMPPAEKYSDVQDYFGFKIWVHYGIGPDEVAYLCPKMMNHDDGECPICEERTRAKKEENDDEYVRALSAKPRVLAYIIDRDHEDDGPILWSIPFTVAKDILNRMTDKRNRSLVPIDDPEKGYDISFIREGTGLKTKYVSVDIERESTPLCDSERLEDDWLDFTNENPLPEILIWHDYEYVSNVFSGKVRRDDKEEKEDEDESPRSRRNRDDEDERSRRRRSRDEDEEDRPRRSRTRDEDEEDRPRRSRDRDEEKDDEKPRRRRVRDEEDDDDKDEKPRRRRVRDEEDQEPEDEDERPRRRRSRDEEDDDEKPRRRRARDDDDRDDDDVDEKLENMRRRRR